MKSITIKILFLGVFVSAGCKPPETSSTAATATDVDRSAVTALRVKTSGTLSFRQYSIKSLRSGIECRLEISNLGEEIAIVRSPKYRVTAGTSGDYFVHLPSALSPENCTGSDPDFSYKSFFVDRRDVELVMLGGDADDSDSPFDPSDLTSRRAEALARNIEQRRSGGGKACGLKSFGQRGCWACVGWSMTDVGLFPSGLGASADASPNGFLRATASARSRKSADGIVTINGVRFRSLKAEFGMKPSFAPRGSILFCNTSAEGHATVVTKPASEMRSDVIEVIGSSWRQSLCWSTVDEILFPLD
ncbi:MAG: hypothetical protein RJB13_2298 [Pseudomonadota bacterium]